MKLFIRYIYCLDRLTELYCIHCYFRCDGAEAEEPEFIHVSQVSLPPGL